MSKYKQKPILIEAKQFNDDNFDEIQKWTGGRAFQFMSAFGSTKAKCIIRKTTRNVYAESGDMIIKSPTGDFDPMKKEDFDGLYEEVKKAAPKKAAPKKSTAKKPATKKKTNAKKPDKNKK